LSIIFDKIDKFGHTGKALSQTPTFLEEIMSGTQRIGIVLMFGSQINSFAKEVSEYYSALCEDPKWHLLQQRDDGQIINHPHLSLLHLDVTERGLADSIEKSRLLSIGTRNFAGTFSSLRVFGDGWYFWLTPRTPEMNRLHANVLRDIAPLRHGNVSEITPDMDPVQVEMVKSYGFTNTGYCWNPHITLTKLRPDSNRNFSSLRNERVETFSSATLAVVRIGKFGAAEEILFSADLEG
jgi:hypothetical protein